MDVYRRVRSYHEFHSWLMARPHKNSALLYVTCSIIGERPHGKEPTDVIEVESGQQAGEDFAVFACDGNCSLLSPAPTVLRIQCYLSLQPSWSRRILREINTPTNVKLSLSRDLARPIRAYVDLLLVEMHTVHVHWKAISTATVNGSGAIAVVVAIMKKAIWIKLRHARVRVIKRWI